jgi:KDO2-lipid IV(A) lauroyltransferase
MAGRRNKLADYLEYLALRIVAVFLGMFSVRTNYRTGRWIGELLWRIDPRHRRIAREHLRRSFPDWPAERVDRVARRSMHNLLYLGLEVAFTPRLITPLTWRRHVRLRNMSETLRHLLAREQGLILLTGHFGNFEVVGYTMATLGFPTISVARPLDNPYIWEHVVGLLERTGQSFLYKKGAMQSADAVLGAGGSLSVVADQDAGRRGLFVDFFGRAASTYKSIALLAIRYEVPVLIGYGKRLSDAFDFEIGVQRIIRPAEWAGEDDPVRWITQEYTRELENVVRSAPEQYLWAHRRWKHRPDGTIAPGGVA